MRTDRGKESSSSCNCITSFARPHERSGTGGYDGTCRSPRNHDGYAMNVCRQAGGLVAITSMMRIHRDNAGTDDYHLAHQAQLRVVQMLKREGDRDGHIEAEKCLAEG